MPLSLKSVLHHYLQTGREALLWKLDGVSEHDVRRPLVPTGTNLLGLVQHVASVEIGYFTDVFARPCDIPRPWFEPGAEPNADFLVGSQVSRADVVGLYHRSWEVSDATIDDLDLDSPGRVEWWGDDGDVTLGQILVHMIAETQRHAGHADILRELIDGKAGLRRSNSNLPWDDDASWSSFHAQVEANARAASD